MHNSALANTQDTLDRLLHEVFDKTQLLKWQREQVRFRAEHEHRMRTIQGGDVEASSHTYVGGFQFRRLEDENAPQWSDVPLHTMLPLQQELGNLTFSINGLQTSDDTIRILFQMHQSSIQPSQFADEAVSRLFPSFTGVVISDDLGTKYVIGHVGSLKSTGSYNTATQRSEQTSENVMTLAPTIPTDARKLLITIQNVCFIPFGHHMVMSEIVSVVEGPWTFELEKSL